MVLQYARFGNLNNWINYDSKNCNYDVKFRIIRNIFKGLKEIHQNQMVHRDFHTGNILISDGSYSDSIHSNWSRIPIEIQISDMGLCGEVDNTDKTKIYGIMPYLAPEVLRGKPYTQAADIYSFGMVMYFIITERQPFENRAHDQVLALNICNGIRPDIPEISELESNLYIDLMKKCWDSNPDNRPNVELISTILGNKDRLLRRKLKEAEKYFFKKYEGNNQLTTHSLAVYTSRLLNHYTEGLAIDFTE
jgi:serine/threonine protein kinase